MIRHCNFWKNIFRLSRIKNIPLTSSCLKAIGYTNLALMAVHCDNLSEVKQVCREKLTHEECIKQACMISANSATTLLTTTTSAILDVCIKYKKSLDRILGLYEELLLTRDENAEIWELMVEYREEVNKMKAALLEMNSYMSSVEKVVNSTTEAAFLAGAEYLCTVLCERLYSAQAEISKYIDEIKSLESDFMKMEQEVARTIKKKENK